MLDGGLLIVAAAVALLFALATLATLRDPARHRAVVAALDLPGWVGFPAVAGEAFLVGALILAPRVGGFLCAVYLATLTAFFGYRWARGYRLEDCGCFGTPHAVGPSLFVRNLVLVLVGMTLALGGAHGSPVLALVVGACLSGLGVARYALATGQERPPYVGPDPVHRMARG